MISHWQFQVRASGAHGGLPASVSFSTGRRRRGPVPVRHGPVIGGASLHNVTTSGTFRRNRTCVDFCAKTLSSFRRPKASDRWQDTSRGSETLSNVPPAAPHLCVRALVAASARGETGLFGRAVCNVYDSLFFYRATFPGGMDRFDCMRPRRFLERYQRRRTARR